MTVRAKWRYVRLPADRIELANGWILERGPDLAQDAAGGIRQAPPGEGAVANWGGPVTVSCNYVRDVRTGRDLFHVMVNMARHRREPAWEEYRMLREAFYPADVDVAIVLPRLDRYVNASEWTFHLWQLPEPWELGRGWDAFARPLVPARRSRRGAGR